MIALFFPILWLAGATGRRLMHLVGFRVSDSPFLTVISSVCIGLTVFSYYMLLVGVLGLMSVTGLCVTVAGLSMLAWGEHNSQYQDCRRCIGSFVFGGWQRKTCAALIVFFAVVGLIGVFAPPTVLIPGINYTEYDSLTYHLADPQYYIRHGRIVPIPWEDHSNFPFSAEMWFAAGLLLHSVPLAKMFHWCCGLLLVGSAYCLGRRAGGKLTGELAGVLTAAIPFVFWESGTSYVDLAYAAFATASIAALAEAYCAKSKDWLIVSALLCGSMLGTKTLAIANAIIICGGIVAYRYAQTKRPSWLGRSDIFRWIAVSAVSGLPWYIRSAAFTGNPIYPFLFGILGGKYWSREAAARVAQENLSFGLGRSFSDFLAAPWAVTQYSLNGGYVQLDPIVSFPHNLPFNYYTSLVNTFSPLMLVCCATACIVSLPSVRILRTLGVYCFLLYMVWFFTMQYSRYLIGILPVLCVVAAAVIASAWEKRNALGRTLVAAMVCSICFSVYTATELGLKLLPVASGAQSHAEYLNQTDYSIGLITYINRTLPKDAKLAFYGFPLGFRCDRDYFWGEKEHGSYIPYDTMHSSQDLAAYFLNHGIDYVVVDDRNFRNDVHVGYSALVFDLIAQQGEPEFSRSFRNGRISLWHLRRP